MQTKVVFYHPKIQSLLLALESSTVAKIVRMLELLEAYGPQLGRPYSKQLTQNIHELRIRGKQEVRILYLLETNRAVILHAFLKKSQKTPQKELLTALRRGKHYLNNK